MASPYVTTLFSESVKSVLDSWTALQLAVDQGFGGPDSREKADWMVYAIETWMNENANIETWELEDFLVDVLNSEFDMILEDSSPQEIAGNIVKYYQLYKGGKEAELRQSIQALPKAALHGCSKAADDEQNQEIEVEEEGTSRQSAGDSGTILQSVAPPKPDQTNSKEDEDMEVEDGWEVVRRGRKK